MINTVDPAPDSGPSKRIKVVLVPASAFPPPQTASSDTMRWHCIACHKSFQGPTDRSPENGCAHCGSRNVFDCNLEPLTPAELAVVMQLFKPSK